MKKKDWALLASVILLPGGSLLGAYWIYKKLKRKEKVPSSLQEYGIISNDENNEESKQETSQKTLGEAL